MTVRGPLGLTARLWLKRSHLVFHTCKNTPLFCLTEKSINLHAQYRFFTWLRLITWLVWYMMHSYCNILIWISTCVLYIHIVMEFKITTRVLYIYIIMLEFLITCHRGLILQDLTFINIGNQDLLTDGSINFAKRWQQFNILDNMRRFKKWYAIRNSSSICNYFSIQNLLFSKVYSIHV